MNMAFELLSSRLRLRRLRADDVAAIWAYRSLSEVARFQSWASFTPDDAARLIANQGRTASNTPGTWLQLALTTREERTIVGDWGIHFLADDARRHRARAAVVHEPSALALLGPGHVRGGQLSEHNELRASSLSALWIKRTVVPPKPERQRREEERAHQSQIRRELRGLPPDHDLLAFQPKHD
jgi:hypothetical protein